MCLTSHAPRLLTLIHQALCLTSVPLDSIDLFAASQGPGSFTGLRIGIATLMGLGHALQRDVIGIDSLEALAMKAWSAPFQVGAVLDARKGEVFGALFHSTVPGPCRMTPNLVMSPEAFCAKITEPTLLLGTGVEVYRGVWERHLRQFGDLRSALAQHAVQRRGGSAGVQSSDYRPWRAGSGAQSELCAPLGS